MINPTALERAIKTDILLKSLSKSKPSDRIVAAYLDRISERFNWPQIVGFNLKPLAMQPSKMPKKYTLESGNSVSIQLTNDEGSKNDAEFDPQTKKIIINIDPRFAGSDQILRVLPLQGGTPLAYTSLIHELVHAVQYDELDKITTYKKLQFERYRRLVNGNTSEVHFNLATEAHAFIAMALAGDHQGINFLDRDELKKKLRGYKTITSKISEHDIDAYTEALSDLLVILYAAKVSHMEIALVIAETRSPTSVCSILRYPSSKSYIDNLTDLVRSKGMQPSEATDARKSLIADKQVRSSVMHEILLDTIERI